MIELVRFGAAWMAVLILAGLTSVPPDPAEFSCCLDQAELKNSTVTEWLYEQFAICSSRFWQSVTAAKADTTRLSGLCRKIENEVWARVTEENQFRVNGLFLSAYCDVQEYVVNIGGAAWYDGQRALGTMSAEVNSAIAFTTSLMNTVVVSLFDTVLESIKGFWNVDFKGFVVNILSCIYGVSVFNIVCSTVESVGTQSTRVPNLPEHNLGMLMANVFSGLMQSIQSLPAVINSYSTGRIYSVPFYHPGYGIFTVISTLSHFIVTTLLHTFSTCLEAVGNMQSESVIVYLKHTWTLVSSYFSTVPLVSVMRMTTVDTCWKVWDVISLPVGQVRSLLQTLLTSMSSPVDIIKGASYTLWVAYAACDSNLYVVRFFRAMAYGFGWYLIVPILTGIADLLGFGSFMLSRFFIEPVASVFIHVFAGLLTTTQLRQLTVHIAQISWEIQSCVIFVLRGIFSAVNGTKLAIQKVTEYKHTAVEKHTEVENGWERSSHMYNRISDLAFAGAFCGLMFVFYRYGPGVYEEICNRWRAMMRKLSTTVRKQNYVQQVIGKQFLAVAQITADDNHRYFHMVSKEDKAAVFLKCLRTSSSRDARIGLAKEYRATRVLLHPNIVKFVTWIRAGHLCALALEYTPFGNLKCAMEATQPRFALKDRLGAFKQVLQAVKFLHNANAAHLNIRPGSILVFDKWSLMKLSGFSHTVKVPDDRRCNQYNLHHVAGPTEVIIRRQPYDPYKADLWALGSLFFYLISGEYLHNKSSKSVPAILLPAIKECDIRHQKSILCLLTSLLCYDPKGRPRLMDVIQTLDELEK